MDIASLSSSLAEAKATIESLRGEHEDQLQGYRQRNDEQMRVAMSAEAEASEARGRRNELEQQIVKLKDQLATVKVTRIPNNTQQLPKPALELMSADAPPSFQPETNPNENPEGACMTYGVPITNAYEHHRHSTRMEVSRLQVERGAAERCDNQPCSR